MKKIKENKITIKRRKRIKKSIKNKIRKIIKKKIKKNIRNKRRIRIRKITPEKFLKIMSKTMC